MVVIAWKEDMIRREEISESISNSILSDLRVINIVFYPHAQPMVGVGDQNRVDIKTDFLKNKT